MLFLAKQFWEKNRTLGKEEFERIAFVFNEEQSYLCHHFENILGINLDNVFKFYHSINRYDGMFDTNVIWKVKEENGQKGEKIVFNYLHALHPELLFRKPYDFEGYDIEGYTEIKEKKDKIKDIRLRAEVKTMLQGGKSFHISINELVKASFFNELYDLYIVKINDDQSFLIYKINNPINFFGIDTSFFEKNIQLENGSIQIASLKIYFEETKISHLRIEES